MKLNLIFSFMSLIICSSIFGEVKSENKEMILFSDKNYELGVHHSLRIIDSTVGENNKFYTVVRVKQLPTKVVSFKLFVATDEKVKDYDFIETQKAKTIRLGKMGFNEDGDLVIPFVIDKKLSIYLLKNQELIKVPLSKLDKMVENVLYEAGSLYILDRRGNVSILNMNNKTTTNINNLLVIDLRDVRNINGNIYLLSRGYKNDNGVFLVLFNTKNTNEHSVIKLDELDGKISRDKLKISLIKGNSLVLSNNQILSPGANPVSTLIKINLNSKEIDYKYAELMAQTVVDIGLVCKDKPTPAGVYAQNIDGYDQLFFEINKKQKNITGVSNILIYDAEIASFSNDVTVLTSYAHIVDGTSYKTLAINRLRNNEHYVCSEKEKK